MLGVGVLGRVGGQPQFFCILSVMICLFFLGARRPAINYSRKLVHAYMRAGMYQKK